MKVLVVFSGLWLMSTIPQSGAPLQSTDLSMHDLPLAWAKCGWRVWLLRVRQTGVNPLNDTGLKNELRQRMILEVISLNAICHNAFDTITYRQCESWPSINQLHLKLHDFIQIFLSQSVFGNLWHIPRSEVNFNLTQIQQVDSWPLCVNCSNFSIYR